MIRQALLVQASRIAIYLMVVFISLTYYFLQEGLNWALLRDFYSVAFLGLLLHSISLFSLQKFFQRKAFLFLSFVVDLILISTLYFLSSLNPTLFLFMYLVMIILGGLVFRFKGALTLAALSSIGFTVAAFLGPDIKAITFIFLLVLNNFAFYAVALLSGYISEQMNLFADQLQTQNLTLANLKEINTLMIEYFPSCLLTVNATGEILQLNPAAQKYFPQMQRGSNLFSLLPQVKVLKNALNLEVQKEENLLKVQVIEQSAADSSFLVWIEDLTETRRKEQALRQTEKMAAIGQLSAGIAHEIRNPLASISGSVELLSQNFSSGDDKKLAQIILKEIDRLNHLITEFLDFAKPEKAPTQKVLVFYLLNEVLESQKNIYPQVKIISSFQGKGEALGESDKLKQAFLNLVVNAYQAMEKSPQAQLEVSGYETAEGLEVKIRDTGCGMSEEVQKKIFEPFFTTKTKGTGLGLALTHKILTAQGVQILVKSQAGLGTEFQLLWQRKP